MQLHWYGLLRAAFGALQLTGFRVCSDVGLTFPGCTSPPLSTVCDWLVDHVGAWCHIALALLAALFVAASHRLWWCSRLDPQGDRSRFVTCCWCATVAPLLRDVDSLNVCDLLLYRIQWNDGSFETAWQRACARARLALYPGTDIRRWFVAAFRSAVRSACARPRVYATCASASLVQGTLS